MLIPFKKGHKNLIMILFLEMKRYLKIGLKLFLEVDLAN